MAMTTLQVYRWFQGKQTADLRLVDARMYEFDGKTALSIRLTIFGKAVLEITFLVEEILKEATPIVLSSYLTVVVSSYLMHARFLSEHEAQQQAEAMLCGN